MKEQKKYLKGKKAEDKFSMNETLDSFDSDYGDDYEETLRFLKAGKRVGARRL